MNKNRKEERGAPSLEEIRDYCRERNNSVDPQRFYDYYTANGWTVGKTVIRDWRAMVRRWESNGYDTLQSGRYSADELNALVTYYDED